MENTLSFLIALFLAWLLIMAAANIMLLTSNLPIMAKMIDGNNLTRTQRRHIGKIATREIIFKGPESWLDYWIMPQQYICIAYLKIKAKLF